LMRIWGDWKLLLTLFVTAVFSLIPIYWQSNQEAKSITVKLVTKAPLQSWEQDMLPEVEIAVDGTKLRNPYLVVIEIQNSGSKPIPASEFETPLSVILKSQSAFVRAKVSAQFPKDIDPVISYEDKKVSINPLLLNPGDKIVLSAITNGDKPSITTKARISGVQNIELIDGTIADSGKAKALFQLVAAMFAFISFVLVSDAILESKEITLRRRSAMVVVLVTLLTGSGLLNNALDKIGVSDFWPQVGATVIMLFILYPLARVLNRTVDTV
jgi:hypothetical protein